MAQEASSGSFDSAPITWMAETVLQRSAQDNRERLWEWWKNSFFAMLKKHGIDFKLYMRLDYSALSVAFTDKTHLSFDIEPGLTVRTAYADMKTGNWREIKRWPRYHSDSGWFEEPGPAPE